MTEPVEGVRSSRRRFFAFMAAAVLVSGLLAIPWPRRSAPLIAADQRRVLPDVALEQLDGGTWRLAEHRGKVVLINYWASWCGPCRAETRGLVRLAEDPSLKGLTVVGISMDVGSRAPVLAFARRMHVVYPIVFPEPMSQMAAGMAGLPTTILVDRQGRVAKTYVGETKEREFRADVEQLVTE